MKTILNFETIVFFTENELKIEVEKLNKKNTKLKAKLSASESNEKLIVSKNLNSRDAATMTTVQALLSFDSPVDVNRLKIDRDFYKQEYMKLVSNQVSDGEINLMRAQLNEKEFELKMLRKQLDSCSKQSRAEMPCRSVEAAMHRLEREKNILEDTVERLTIERNELRESLRLTTTTQHEQQGRNECEIERLKEKIRHLESENLSLQMCQGPSKTTITVLKDEMNKLRTEITELTEENSKLRTTNSQLKTIQDQTESVLHEHQNRLTHSARQLSQAESRLTVVDSSRSQGCREIGELRAEVSRLKSINTQLEAERDKMMVCLKCFV